LVSAQSYAANDDKDANKITKDYKNSIQKDVNPKSDRTNQHLGQDSLCYKDDDCEQTNEGEQIKGKDNEARGFNDQSALESVDNQGQPGPGGPECPSGFTFNESTKKCEKPACTDGFAFNAGTQQCERPTTAQATCPDGSAATSATCPGTTTNVPATCPANYAGPSSTGTCTGPLQRIKGICPDPIGATVVFQGPYINNQGQCEIVSGGTTASNYPGCFGNVISKTCMDGLFTCPDGFAIFDLVTGTCSGTPTTQATCPDGSAATSATCPVTGPAAEATCPAGFTGPDATGRCTGTDTGTKQCVNPNFNRSMPSKPQILKGQKKQTPFFSQAQSPILVQKKNG
jgi:hypothetical protein